MKGLTGHIELERAEYFLLVDFRPLMKQIWGKIQTEYFSL